MKQLPYKQAIELIKRSSNILLVLPNDPSTDAIASSLALFLALEKNKKKAKIVCYRFSLPATHSFLPKSQEIFSDLDTLKKFIISLDVRKTKVEELSYDINDERLNIYITPKNGFFTEKDISTSTGGFDYDLIIVLDSTDLDSLGKLYDNNAEFFFNTPIINVDHDPANDYFGQINLVDIMASSTSEIVFELIKEMGENILDEQIATNLLTGIISKTKSYRSPSVTPKSLAISSHLVASGARRDEIIRNLYQTKSISTLKLWGRVLARLKEDYNQRFIWSLITRQDFEKAKARDEDLFGVIDELIVNIPQAEIVILLYESRGNKIEAIIYTIRQIDGFRLFREFKPEGTRDFTKIEIPAPDIVEAEKKVINKVSEYYRQRP